ncbi:MAG TPA: C-type lectin domain-containing protein [Kofleriaceae bacterium]|nr:C-type lectin domain-containing protein [Kofleriaceae bacterium]
MWRVLVLAVSLTGCGRLFGLEPPTLDDGTVDEDASVSDASSDARIADAPADTPSNALCPQSYSMVLGTSPSRYRFVNGGTAWDVAQAACLADQITGSTRFTHLIVAANDAELSALDAALGGEKWVGLSDRAIEGAYQWVTAETNNYPPSTGGPWGTDEPKASGAEDCVLMSNTGDLEMRSCGLGRQYVCECDAFPNDPTKY